LTKIEVRMKLTKMNCLFLIDSGERNTLTFDIFRDISELDMSYI